MRETESAFGQQVYSEAERLRLRQSPKRCVFVSDMCSRPRQPTETRATSPFRIINVHGRVHHLAAEILAAEYQSMFPDSLITWRALDYLQLHLDNKDIAGADIVFMAVIAQSAEIAADFARRHGDQKLCVVGGPHVTRTAKSFHEASEGKALVVKGRLEGIMPQAQFLIESGNHQGETVRASDRFNAASSYHYLPRDGVASRVRQNYGGVPVEFGVGCAGGCRFCGITTFVESNRSPHELIAELERLRQRGVKLIMVVDDDISRRDPALLEAAFSYLNKHKIGWIGMGSNQILQYPGLAKKMAHGNVMFLHGLDDLTGTADTDDQNKGRSPREVIEDLQRLQRLGFSVFGSLVVGLDDQAYPGTFIETAGPFVRDEITAPVAVHLCVPFPGTPFYNDLRKQGRLLTDNLNRYNFGEPVFSPANMTTEQLVKGARWLQREISGGHHLMVVLREMAKSAGMRKFIRHPQALATMVILAFDQLFTGLTTKPDQTLQGASQTSLNKLWGKLAK